MVLLKQLKIFLVSTIIAFALTACGGGDSSSDNGSQAGNPEIAGSYSFRGQGGASGESFNATFTANTFNFDTEENDSGTFTFTNARKINLALSSGEKVSADLEVNGDNQVVKITTRAPDGTTFVGTRR